MLDILKTVLLGIVEGLTEWLPISSTGHMILLDEFIRLDISDAFKELFLVVIQLGAILAVVLLFWNKIWPFHLKSTAAKPFFTAKNGKPVNGIQSFCNDYIYMDRIILWLKIALASLPAAVLGILFDDQLDAMLVGDLRAYIVASALIVYGILFIVIERREHKVKVKSVEAISFPLAFWIGVIQCLALVPGTSRSGSTILGAVMLGTSRLVAAEFSFFLSIPAMIGGSGIKLLMFFAHGNTVTPHEMAVLIVGTVVAFLVSVFAIKFLVSYIKKHDFQIFGYYRIILGVIVLLYFAFAS
ncbi:MAG: undecaprenyl-diphosphate phosphatase [Clostridia bacterium]|nr:undecaprenyl-diphosphate phosphatase [Clostridia bacterium]